MLHHFARLFSCLALIVLFWLIGATPAPARDARKRRRQKESTEERKTVSGRESTEGEESTEGKESTEGSQRKEKESTEGKYEEEPKEWSQRNGAKGMDPFQEGMWLEPQDPGAAEAEIERTNISYAQHHADCEMAPEGATPEDSVVSSV